VRMDFSRRVEVIEDSAITGRDPAQERRSP
jgi:hypothetical protein